MIKVKVKSVRESKSLKEWFSEKDFRAMDASEQEQYLKDHPNSKFQPDNGGNEDNKDDKSKEVKSTDDKEIQKKNDDQQSTDTSTWFNLSDNKTDSSDKLSDSDKKKLPSINKVLGFRIPEEYLDNLDEQFKKEFKTREETYKQLPILDKLSNEASEEIDNEYQDVRKKFAKVRSKWDYDGMHKIAKEYSDSLKKKGYELSPNLTYLLLHHSPDLKDNHLTDKAVTDYYKDAKWEVLAKAGALPYHRKDRGDRNAKDYYTWKLDKTKRLSDNEKYDIL